MRERERERGPRTVKGIKATEEEAEKADERTRSPSAGAVS